MSWSVVAEVIGIVGQPTIVRLMPGLRPSRTGVLAFLFLAGGRRLRRSPRRFVRSLKLDHQLNQLVLAQALQISAIHAHMDSEIGLPGKGARKSGASSRSARRKWRWVITIFLDAGVGFRFKNRMIREAPSAPSREELIALVAALMAENAALKARIAELERRLGLNS